ncbi:MAG: dTDP-4-dehydrorhamnose 3,5-epimerase [Deltaproteobacteria bacterium]|nr:dTDP-4-dehydrorhamnose 3,5-epimerase [Deltaproteobacteria bacterium]
MRFLPDAILPEVVHIEPDIFEDDRGFFTELYHREKFDREGITVPFVQDNRSRSRRGVIRGLHYQVGRPQGKLVWVLSGQIYDVAVDIRRASPRFGTWCAARLSGEGKKALYIPPDFAHGFCVLSEWAEVFYKCTEIYSPDRERGIRWDDPDLAIDWPVGDPILSDKDRNCPLLREAELP